MGSRKAQWDDDWGGEHANRDGKRRHRLRKEGKNSRHMPRADRFESRRKAALGRSRRKENEAPVFFAEAEGPEDEELFDQDDSALAELYLGEPDDDLDENNRVPRGEDLLDEYGLGYDPKEWD